jgi:segregation and condensation protein B
MTPEQATAEIAPDETELAAEMDEALEAEADGALAAEPLPPAIDRAHLLRVVEAMLFAASQPLGKEELGPLLPQGTDLEGLMAELGQHYEGRGVNLVRVAGKWGFRTADDLGFLMRREATEQRRLSKAAIETLAIIAYHQPVTRAEIEEIRGVAISKGTLDMLLELGWVKMRGRRRVPGRPVTYGTTDAFLVQFGLGEINDLPGLMELKGAGLLEANLPPDFAIPAPRSGDELAPDEDPLDSEGEGDQPELDMNLPEEAEASEVTAAEDTPPEGEDDAPTPPWLTRNGEA